VIPIYVAPPRLLPDSKKFSVNRLVVNAEEATNLQPVKANVSGMVSDQNIAEHSLLKVVRAESGPKHAKRSVTLSYVERKAVELCKRVEPCEDNSPLMIMRPIFDEALEGLGPKSRPCARNQVNTFYCSMLPNEVIEQGDVLRALRIKDDAMEIMDSFKRFAAAYHKTVSEHRLLDAALVQRDALEANIAGTRMVLEDALSSGENQDNVLATLRARIEQQTPVLDESNKRLDLASEAAEAAQSALEKIEATIKDPYLHIVRQCYELNSEIQQRMQKMLNSAIKSSTSSLGMSRAQRKVTASHLNDSSGLHDLDEHIASLVAKQSRLFEWNSKLQACKAWTKYALSSLDQRWEKFSLDVLDSLK
jgi:hypothetical protein